MTKTIYERLGIAPGDIPQIDQLVQDYGQEQLGLNQGEKAFALYQFSSFVDDRFYDFVNSENPRPYLAQGFETQLESFEIDVPDRILLKLIILYAQDLLNGVYKEEVKSQYINSFG